MVSKEENEMSIQDFKPIDPSKIEFVLENVKEDEKSDEKLDFHHTCKIRIILGVLVFSLALLIIVIAIRHRTQTVTNVKRYVEKEGTRAGTNISQEVKDQFRYYCVKDFLESDYLVTLSPDASTILVASEHADYLIKSSNITAQTLCFLVSRSEHDLSLLKDLYPDQADKHLTIIVTDQLVLEMSQDSITLNIRYEKEYSKTMAVYLLQSFYPDTIHYGLAYEMMAQLDSWYELQDFSKIDCSSHASQIQPDMLDQLSFELPVFTLTDFTDIDVSLNHELLKEFMNYILVKGGCVQEVQTLLMESATDYPKFRSHYEQLMNGWLVYNNIYEQFVYGDTFVRPCSAPSKHITFDPFEFKIDDYMVSQYGYEFLIKEYQSQDPLKTIAGEDILNVYEEWKMNSYKNIPVDNN